LLFLFITTIPPLFFFFLIHTELCAAAAAGRFDYIPLPFFVLRAGLVVLGNERKKLFFFFFFFFFFVSPNPIWLSSSSSVFIISFSFDHLVRLFLASLFWGTFFLFLFFSFPSSSSSPIGAAAPPTFEKKRPAGIEYHHHHHLHPSPPFPVADDRTLFGQLLATCPCVYIHSQKLYSLDF
jgi:hypothetical protein